MPNNDNERLVEEFCGAWAKRDVDGILGYFTPDAVYHNIPLDPVNGRAAIREFVTGFTGGVDKLEFQVDHIAASGNVVLTERVDYFHSGERTIALPVMGTFEVVDGKIAKWRDYFDLNQFMSQMAPG